MRGRRNVNTSILLCSLLFALSFALSVDFPETVSAYTPHDPIYIDGNENFTSTNGVTEGNGTPSNPYIIEGWEIDASSAHGIAIENTDAHFVIRDVHIHSGGPNYNRGVRLSNITDGRVENATLPNNWGGVTMYFSSNLTIRDNEVVSSNETGIAFHTCNNITVEGNNVSMTGQDGIVPMFSGNVTIVNNNVWDNEGGVVVYQTTNISIRKNNVSSNEWGVVFEECDNITVDDNNVLENRIGIHLFYSPNVALRGNNISSNRWIGVIIDASGNANLTDNGITENGQRGITSHHSNNLTFQGNIISGNPNDGIYLLSCENITIRNNSISKDSRGIFVEFSDNIAIAGNDISNCTSCVDLDSSNNASIVGNSISGIWGGIGIVNASIVDIEDNHIGLFDGYGIFTGSVGNMTVSGNNISGNDLGIGFNFCDNTTISSNEILNNRIGIYLLVSENIVVVGNNISNSSNDGIFLFFSSSILVYHNSFVNNTVQVYDDLGEENHWDDGYPSGGNYWSDYSGVDYYRGPEQNILGSDGIGDTPYDIDADSIDRYPLISPGGLIPLPLENLTAVLSGENLENVTLMWNPSPDESIAFVQRYDVYRGNVYDKLGSLYQHIGSVPSGNYTFVDTFAGESNPSPYFYVVCAVNLTNSSVCADDQGGKLTRPLFPGPNLVSVPLVQSNESVKTVLQTVEYDKAWFYDSSSQEWKWHMTSKEYRRGLWNVNHTMGLWVNVTGDCSLTVAGIVPAQSTIHLHKGWNLIGFPSFNTSYTVADMKAEVGGTRVEGFESMPVFPPYYLRVLGDAEALQTGFGYWLRVKADTTWTVEVS